MHIFYLPGQMCSPFSQDRPSARGRLVIINNTLSEGSALMHIKVTVVNYEIIRYIQQMMFLTFPSILTSVHFDAFRKALASSDLAV